MLDRIVRVGLLLDFYGCLLTERQRSCAELRYWEDLSLGEIASLLHVSRQAVYDTLKRTETCLGEYEAKLGLLRDHLAEQRRLEEILQMVDAAERELDRSGSAAGAASRLRAARLAARELLSSR